MNTEKAKDFLFAIVSEVKRSLERPVLWWTMKDYADTLFNSLVGMLAALLQDEKSQQVVDLINNLHQDWLESILEVEQLKKRIRDIPRDNTLKAIDFTIEATEKRLKYFQRYIGSNLQQKLTTEQRMSLQDDLVVMTGTMENLISVLRDKQKCFTILADSIEYYQKMTDELDELLCWMDTLTESVAVLYSQFVEHKDPDLVKNLTRALYHIVDNVSASTDLDSEIIAKQIYNKSRSMSCIIRMSLKDLETAKIVEKIKSLEDRIFRLKNKGSSAVMALQHKTIYLEERLQSLENLKKSLLALQNNKVSTVNQDDRVHIFNHLLPHEGRLNLINNLNKIWKDAMQGKRSLESQSIISILSIANINEFFNDHLGEFIVDKHGRKLYRGSDDKLYQVNEKNELVPLCDDKKVYFYDDCGRYYLNDNNQRIYKAHENASEYYIHYTGRLLKMKEFRKGKEFYYDHLGRYFLKNGKRIYSEKNDTTDYEADGLGNINKVRDVEMDYQYHVCAPEPIVTEESRYLQRTVGVALRKCIADVVLRQPPDPILYLAKSLEKYQQSIRMKQQRLDEAAELMVQRELRMRAEYQAVTANASSVSDEYCPYSENNRFINFEF